MKHRSLSDKVHSMPKAIAIGTLTTITVLLICILILAYLVSIGTVETEAVKHVIVIILVMSTYVGVLLTNKMMKKQYAIICLIHSAVIISLLMGVHIFFFAGAFKGVAGTMIGICLGGVGACLSCMSPKKSRKKRRNR